VAAGGGVVAVGEAAAVGVGLAGVLACVVARMVAVAVGGCAVSVGLCWLVAAEAGVEDPAIA
jgi:hypothetical protein